MASMDKEIEADLVGRIAYHENVIEEAKSDLKNARAGLDEIQTLIVYIKDSLQLIECYIREETISYMMHFKNHEGVAGCIYVHSQFIKEASPDIIKKNLTFLCNEVCRIQNTYNLNLDIDEIELIEKAIKLGIVDLGKEVVQI